MIAWICLHPAMARTLELEVPLELLAGAILAARIKAFLKPSGVKRG